MMKQIFSIKDIEDLQKIIDKKKTVLVGGCFDIIHMGHISFLENAKSKGEILLVLLESDKNINKNKGKNRPINNQKNRALLLTKLRMVDYVINLPEMKSDEDYLKIIKIIKPKVIAVSSGDKKWKLKEKEAEMVGGRLIKVVEQIPHQSTTRIIEIITKSF